MYLPVTAFALLGFRAFAVQAFKMPTGAMIPTLQIGDHILVSKLAYGRLELPLTQTALVQLPGFRAPRVGDVIVFVYPRERDKDFVKRIASPSPDRPSRRTARR